MRPSQAQPASAVLDQLVSVTRHIYMYTTECDAELWVNSWLHLREGHRWQLQSRQRDRLHQLCQINYELDIVFHFYNCLLILFPSLFGPRWRLGRHWNADLRVHKLAAGLKLRLHTFYKEAACTYINLAGRKSPNQRARCYSGAASGSVVIVIPYQQLGNGVWRLNIHVASLARHLDNNNTHNNK